MYVAASTKFQSRGSYGFGKCRVSTETPFRMLDRARAGPRCIMPSMNNETAFEMAVSNIRFGAGVTREVGSDLKDLGVRTALVFADPKLRAMRPIQTVLESLDANGIAAIVYDPVRVEPSDESFHDAIAFARHTEHDGFVAVGGGSTMDTAKAVNLYTTYPPDDFLDYVNPPIGKGLPVPGP